MSARRERKEFYEAYPLIPDESTWDPIPGGTRGLYGSSGCSRGGLSGLGFLEVAFSLSPGSEWLQGATTLNPETLLNPKL